MLDIIKNFFKQGKQKFCSFAYRDVWDCQIEPYLNFRVCDRWRQYKTTINDLADLTYAMWHLNKYHHTKEECLEKVLEILVNRHGQQNFMFLDSDLKRRILYMVK